MVDVSRETNDRSAVQVLIPVDGILDVPHLPARFHPVAGRRARHRRARKRQDVLQPEGAPAVVCAGHLTHHGLGRDKQSTFGGWDMLHPLIKFYRDTLCIRDQPAPRDTRHHARGHRARREARTRGQAPRHARREGVARADEAVRQAPRGRGRRAEPKAGRRKRHAAGPEWHHRLAALLPCLRSANLTCLVGQDVEGVSATVRCRRGGLPWPRPRADPKSADPPDPPPTWRRPLAEASRPGDARRNGVAPCRAVLQMQVSGRPPGGACAPLLCS